MRPWAELRLSHGANGIELWKEVTTAWTQQGHRLPHRVSFERGWSWTTTAICHGGQSDGPAFRQRSDGEGINVRVGVRNHGGGPVEHDYGAQPPEQLLGHWVSLNMCASPLVATALAITPFSVGKYRGRGRVPNALR